MERNLSWGIRSIVDEAILLLVSTIVNGISSVSGTKVVNYYEKWREVAGLQRMMLHLYSTKAVLQFSDHNVISTLSPLKTEWFIKSNLLLKKVSLFKK